MKFYSKLKVTMMILLGLMLTASEVFAQLKIESVYPSLGKMGEDLEVTIKGSGFDGNTRVSMYLDVGHKKSIVGSVDTPGFARGVAAVNDRAYMADDTMGLQVIDVSDPANPKIMGSVDTPGNAYAVTVVGDTAYVADGSSGLQVIDISNPASPQIIGSVDTLGSAYDVMVVGDRAYVADGVSGLQVIDVGNPASPQIIGSVDTPYIAYGVMVVGDMAYVADAYSGLQVIDVGNPASPQIIGSVDTPVFASKVTVVSNKAYVMDDTSGIQVIDVSDPASPQIIGSVDTPGAARALTVVGDTAYVADSGSGVQVIDISDPANPEIMGSVDTPYSAAGVAVVGDKAYVADGSNGLQVIDISNPAKPQEIGSIDTPGVAYAATLVGDRAYVADDTMGLQVIDISNPADPQIIGSIDTPSHAVGVNVVATRAYVADGYSGLQVIDISNPANPQIIGSVDTPSDARGIAVLGDRAYVADAYSGLQAIDISNPADPQIIGSVDTPGNARGVTVAGNKAYVADDTMGLQVIDISNPANPQIIGSVGTPGYAWAVTVVGDRAFVADSGNGLQVIDIGNPATPQIIGSVDTPGHAFAVTVVGDTAYVADGSTGVQVIDISDPANPQIIGSVDTPGSAYAVTVADGRAYVADGGGGLVVLPVPVEVVPVIVNSPTSISVTLPSPQIAGHYTLRVFNGTESYELPGAVTFLTAEEYEAAIKKKAIIVAGGGPYQGNDLWEATRTCAHFAYLSLLSQGYTRENIYYLNPETDVDVDGDGLCNDIDTGTTTANLSYAINVWAKDANDVLIYMTDHGGSETFMLNGSETPREQIEAETLDAWLDDLQETMLGKVILIYDACYSGSFVSQLTPPAGKERIVVTSTLPDERAWFLLNGTLSFSYQFWASVFLNANLYVSYVTAGNMMRNDQTALLDANGNGSGNEKEDRNLANNVIIGRGRVAASVPPVIGLFGQERTGPTSAVLRAGNIDSLNPIARVWAVIIPPGYDSGLSDEPVIDMPTVDLVDPDQNGVYEGIYDNFNEWGTYRITFFAKDTKDAYSLPKQITLTQESGPDAFEDDDTYLSASVMHIGDPEAQRHNFHDAGDQDWVRFYAVAGESYEIKVENLESKCDAVVVLYDRDGTTRLTNPDPPYNEGDQGLYGENELISWQCPVDGIYYVMVKQYLNTDFGPDTGYDLKVYRPSAANPGFLKGKVSDALEVGVGGAVLKSDTVNATAMTTPEGYYLMCLPAGTYTVTAEAQGFLPQSHSGVEVTEAGTSNLNFSLSSLAGAKKADLNNDSKVDLGDLIIALRALTGLGTAGLIRDDYATSGTDVNGDNKVGVQEVIYILQAVADLR